MAKKEPRQEGPSGHLPQFFSKKKKGTRLLGLQLMFSQLFSQLRRTYLATNKDERQRFEATLNNLVEPFSEQYQEETLPILRNLSSVVTSGGHCVGVREGVVVMS